MDYMDVVTAMLGEPRAFDHKATRLQSGHMPHSQRTPDTLDICLYTAKSDWLQYQMKSSKRTTTKKIGQVATSIEGLARSTATQQHHAESTIPCYARIGSATKLQVESVEATRALGPSSQENASSTQPHTENAQMPGPPDHSPGRGA